MSVRKKQERKQRQTRNRKQRELARREERKAHTAGSSLGEKLRFDDPEPLIAADKREPVEQQDDTNELLEETSELDTEPSEPAEPEEAGCELWWDKFSNANGPQRLEMAREKLKTVSADDDAYEQLFPEAIYELESKLSREQYVAFLEEVRETRPDVFSMSADWNTRAMVFEYLAQERLHDVDRAVIVFAEQLKDIGSPFFSLMSAIRLAGRVKAAQALIEAAVKQLENSSLTEWAVDEILEWAMFAHYQRCMAAGATDKEIETVHAAARDLGIKDSEQYQTNRRDFVLHLSGQSSKQWTKDELTNGKPKAFRNIYLLGVDYERWLCNERDFEPIVANELRHLVITAIDGIECPFDVLLVGLTRRHFEPYLAGKFDFMSLNRIQAPATIVAMKHYYDFLKELELVKSGDWHKSQSICDALWKEVRRSLEEEWPCFRFLDQYIAN